MAPGSAAATNGTAQELGRERFEALGPALNPNQLDRVFVNQFPPLGTLKNRVHKTSDMALGLRGQSQVAEGKEIYMKGENKKGRHDRRRSRFGLSFRASTSTTRSSDLDCESFRIRETARDLCSTCWLLH